MKMQLLRLLTIALVFSLSGCYQVQIQSQFNDDVAVSISKTYPQELPQHKTRHFSHTFYQWYIVGLVPYDFWNGFAGAEGLKSQQYVDFVLQKEAANAVAVNNLKVTVSRTPEGFIGSILVGLIPAIGGLVNGNMTVTVEGDVVESMKP